MKYLVRVKLNKNFIEIKDDVIIVGVRSKPEGGKANQEVIEKIADYFHVSNSRVRIVLGQASRRKMIEVI